MSKEEEVVLLRERAIHEMRIYLMEFSGFIAEELEFKVARSGQCIYPSVGDILEHAAESVDAAITNASDIGFTEDGAPRVVLRVGIILECDSVANRKLIRDAVKEQVLDFRRRKADEGNNG